MPGTEEQVLKILIVDDEAAIVEEVAECLAIQGYLCRQATSGGEAIEILDAEPDIALVITDLRMPGMSGEELIARYRQRQGALVKIIVVTGHGAVAAGFPDQDGMHVTHVLHKPVDVADLVRAVEEALSGRRDG